LLTITVCVGSSCYVRGSEKLAETLQRLVERERISAQVEFTGAFCMEQCSMGVSVCVGERVYRCVQPENAEGFFYDEVLPNVNGGAAPEANETAQAAAADEVIR
jgi:NADH:ubiquinone oxidoreductase subunit E